MKGGKVPDPQPPSPHSILWKDWWGEALISEHRMAGMFLGGLRNLGKHGQRESVTVVIQFLGRQESPLTNGGCLCQSATDSVLKQQKFIVLQFWRLTVLGQDTGAVDSSKGCEGRICSRLLPLACRCPSSPWVSQQLLPSMHECLCAQISPFYDNDNTGLQFILMTSLYNLFASLKILSSKKATFWNTGV